MLTKCGEIFYDNFYKNAQTYCVIFVCDCCHEKYYKLTKFLKHLTEKSSQDGTKIEYTGENVPAMMVNDKELVELYNCSAETKKLTTRSRSTKDIPDSIHILCDEDETPSVLIDVDNSNEILSVKKTPVTITKVNSNEAKYYCSQCKENFHLYKEYAKHKCDATVSLVQIQRKTKVERKAICNNFICGKCEKVCKSKHGLRIHENTHMINKPYQCDRCAASYADKGNLMDHIRRHTGEKPYVCQYCPSKFVTSTERRIHEGSHTGEKPFNCDKCARTFITSSHLKKHQLMAHLDARNYPCNMCDKRFHSAPNLRKHHMNIHMELPRIHECDICIAAFKTIKQLKVHKQIHLPHRYKCQIYGKTFAHYAGLYSHRKIHQKQQNDIDDNR